MRASWSDKSAGQGFCDNSEPERGLAPGPLAAPEWPACGDSEPERGLEPLTYALRERRSTD